MCGSGRAHERREGRNRRGTRGRTARDAQSRSLDGAGEGILKDWPVLVFGRAAWALLIERFAGYPQPVFDRISHPVVWIGKLIDWLDKQLNVTGVSPQEGRLRGAVAVLVLLAGAGYTTGTVLALDGGRALV